MPDGQLYDGRYNLRKDIEDYMRFAVDPNDPKDWADYYGVPVARYVEGQEWSSINLDRLRQTTSYLTRQVVDVWELLGIFKHFSGFEFFCSQALSTSAHLPETQPLVVLSIPTSYNSD